MGSDQSKPVQPTIDQDVDPSDENHFFVEQIEKVSLRNRRQVSYYWIDPKVYNAQNQKYYNQFLAHFKIESFTSLQALKSQLEEIQNNELIKVITAASLDDNDYRELQNEPKIAQVFLFCGNEERAKLLCKNFPKIRGYALKSQQMIEVLKKFELQDKLDIPPCSLLCMLEEDRKLLNRYRLNYFCITAPHHRIKSKQDIAKLARFLLPDQADSVDQFQKQYNLALKGEEAHAQALRWAFEDSFYWKLVEGLPKATTDPKKLGYLRLPFGDLFQAVFDKKVQKNPEELYIVAQLNQQELNRLRDGATLDNFIIFTSFMKGFTKKTDAIKEFKESDRSFLFQVTFTDRKREPKLDFGFVVSEDKTIKKNVLFNIYNFFQLEVIELQKRTGTLIYGPLAQAFYNRADQTSKKRLTENQQILLRNYDYIEELIRRDNSQAVILQISGYFKQSLEIYDKKVEFLRKTRAPETDLSKFIILRGDSYRMNQDYEQAEKDYKSITHEDYKLVASVHLLQLYMRKNDERQTQILQQLQQPSAMRKLKQKFPQQGFNAQNYVAMQWMKQGRFKQALKKYKNLQSQATIYYQYRFQGIPIVHDIFRNMATCEARLNNHKEALNLLTSTKDWQLVCEGESAGLALTETMIQHVHEEIGNQECARETADTLHHLTQHINIQEKRYLNQSVISISMGLRQPKNVNQSASTQNVNSSSSSVKSNPVNNHNPQANVHHNAQQINVNNSAVNVNLNAQPINVNNSAVNVNLNQQPINVNNSSVNVNLNPQPINVNNSSVNVNLNPQPVNLNNSLVNVNLNPQPVNLNNSIVDVSLNPQPVLNNNAVSAAQIPKQANIDISEMHVIQNPQPVIEPAHQPAQQPVNTNIPLKPITIVEMNSQMLKKSSQSPKFNPLKPQW